MKTKKILYHGTYIDNVESIKKEGLSRFFEGVYLTDTADSAAKWTGFKASARGQSEFAVIKVEVDADKLSEGTDHSELMVKIFGVGQSILHQGAIGCKSILDVIYYSIGKNKNNEE